MKDKTPPDQRQTAAAVESRADGIPYCPGPDPAPRPPAFEVPGGAIDCHAHVFGPESRYPYSPQRGYTPPDATLEAFLKLHQTLGMARGVLTQPSVYGIDNSAILDAAAAAGTDRLRAVIAVSRDVSDAELEAFHGAGARGVRINLVDKGGMPFESLEDVAQFTHRLKDLGWHLEVLIHVAGFPDLRRTFESMAVDVVVGHLGYMNTVEGLGNAGFQVFLDLLRDGICWAKLSGAYRITDLGAPPYDDVIPFARALIEANPERVVWGTDWPHPVFYKTMPNDGYLLDQLSHWTDEEDLVRKILVGNPEKLYGFSAYEV